MLTAYLHPIRMSPYPINATNPAKLGKDSDFGPTKDPPGLHTIEFGDLHASSDSDSEFDWLDDFFDKSMIRLDDALAHNELMREEWEAQERENPRPAPTTTPMPVAVPVPVVHALAPAITPGPLPALAPSCPPPTPNVLEWRERPSPAPNIELKSLGGSRLESRQGARWKQRYRYQHHPPVNPYTISNWRLRLGTAILKSGGVAFSQWYRPPPHHYTSLTISI
jgi:hypothetical protein